MPVFQRLTLMSHLTSYCKEVLHHTGKYLKTQDLIKSKTNIQSGNYPPLLDHHDDGSVHIPAASECWRKADCQLYQLHWYMKTNLIEWSIHLFKSLVCILFLLYFQTALPAMSDHIPLIVLFYRLDQETTNKQNKNV